MNIIPNKYRQALSIWSVVVLFALFSASCSRNMTARHSVTPNLTAQQSLDVPSEQENEKLVLSEEGKEAEMKAEQSVPASQPTDFSILTEKPAQADKPASRTSLKEYAVKKTIGRVFAARQEANNWQKSKITKLEKKRDAIGGNLRLAVLFLLLSLFIALIGGFLRGGVGELFGLIAAIFAILGIVFLVLWLIEM